MLSYCSLCHYINFSRYCAAKWHILTVITVLFHLLCTYHLFANLISYFLLLICLLITYNHVVMSYWYTITYTCGILEIYLCSLNFNVFISITNVFIPFYKNVICHSTTIASL